VRLSDIPNLPPTLTAAETAELLWVSVWSIYEQVKAGTSPVSPLHLGRRVLFPTAAVLRAIGIEPTFRAHDPRDGDEAALSGLPGAADSGVPGEPISRQQVSHRHHYPPAAAAHRREPRS